MFGSVQRQILLGINSWSHIRFCSDPTDWANKHSGPLVGQKKQYEDVTFGSGTKNVFYILWKKHYNKTC